MADETAKPADETLIVVGNAAAPFIYFDGSPTYGVMHGAINVELIARTIVPGHLVTSSELVVTAHLRCSPIAARELRDTLDKALFMLERPDGLAN